MLLILACTSGVPLPHDTPAQESPPESAGLESIPGLDTQPPRTLDAPAQLELTCPQDIPLDGKTDCRIKILWPDGEIAHQGRAATGVHGRSSSGFPKQQYAIELQDQDGADENIDLFGMGADADWLLNGMYVDRALFRNKLAYDLSRELAHPAPECVYAELTLNGSYWGVYTLCERLERGDDRVDIAKDEGQGESFLLRADESGLASTVQYALWDVLYPEEDTPAVTTGIRTRMGQIEVLMLNQSASLWEEVDQTSFLDFVLIEELMKNNDAYFLSHHVYTDKNDQQDFALHFIPWDLDLSLGQPNYNENWRADSWILYRPALVASSVLAGDAHAQLAARWAVLRQGIFATQAILDRLEGYRNFLGPAIARNFERWDITQIQFGANELYPVSSPEEEYELVKTWITSHLEWMDIAIAAY